MTEPHSLTIDVRFKFKFDDIIASSQQAISPDGGWEGTLNEHIEEYATSFINDVTHLNTSWHTTEASWTLSEDEA